MIMCPMVFLVMAPIRLRALVMKGYLAYTANVKPSFSEFKGQWRRTKGIIGKAVISHAYFMNQFLSKGGWEDNQSSAYWGFLMSDFCEGAWGYSIWLLVKKLLVSAVLTTLDGGRNAIFSTTIQFVDMGLLLYLRPFVCKLTEFSETLGAITSSLAFLAISIPVMFPEIELPNWLGDFSIMIMASFATALSVVFALVSPIYVCFNLIFKFTGMISSKVRFACPDGVGAGLHEAKQEVAGNTQNQLILEAEEYYTNEPSDPERGSEHGDEIIVPEVFISARAEVRIMAAAANMVASPEDRLASMQEWGHEPEEGSFPTRFLPPSTLHLPSTPSSSPPKSPTTMTPIRPATPPTMCTTPEPAKSIMPRDVSLPERIGRALPSASGMAPQAERNPEPQPQCTNGSERGWGGCGAVAYYAIDLNAPLLKISDLSPRKPDPPLSAGPVLSAFPILPSLPLRRQGSEEDALDCGRPLNSPMSVNMQHHSLSFHSPTRQPVDVAAMSLSERNGVWRPKPSNLRRIRPDLKEPTFRFSNGQISGGHQPLSRFARPTSLTQEQVQRQIVLESDLVCVSSDFKVTRDTLLASTLSAQASTNGVPPYPSHERLMIRSENLSSRYPCPTESPRSDILWVHVSP